MTTAVRLNKEPNNPDTITSPTLAINLPSMLLSRCEAFAVVPRIYTPQRDTVVGSPGCVDDQGTVSLLLSERQLVSQLSFFVLSILYPMLYRTIPTSHCHQIVQEGAYSGACSISTRCMTFFPLLCLYHDPGTISITCSCYIRRVHNATLILYDVGESVSLFNNDYLWRFVNAYVRASHDPPVATHRASESQSMSLVFIGAFDQHI